MAITIPQNTADQIFFGRWSSSAPAGHKRRITMREIEKKVDIRKTYDKPILTVDKIALCI